MLDRELVAKFQKMSPEFRKEMGLPSLKDVFLAEKNAENRMKIVKVNGIDAIYEAVGAKTIDKDGSYELISLDLGEKSFRPYLKMINPSTGSIHIEGVHPDCKTVKAALEWRNETDKTPDVIS